MALVRSLALSQGGGIISYNQQAKQEENIVNIFIGLGGTGVDCLREIKTQVYNRIEPDLITNDGKVVYEHIRFLGVDRDIMSFHSIGDEDSRCNCLPLFESEMFALAGSGITLKNVKRASDVFTQYAWLSDHIDQIGLDDYEPSGLRQEGRFLIMANADKFMARVQNVIADSKRGLCNPRVVIHIISGLGGATGSGIFLDVCYMLREILKAECNTGMCGYFFIPDVNVSHVRIERVKKYIRVNGYAAMQELDYCMNIEKNHGKFRQEYTGGKLIDWDCAPVDYCHLISAIDNNGNVRQDAYNYVMKVMSEYALEFIKKSVTGVNVFSFLHSLSAIAFEKEEHKSFGYNVKYLTIGASSAIVPLKEINTYLATRLFDRFSEVGKDIPDESDVWNFTVGVFGEDKSDKDIQSRVYDALYATLQGDSKEEYTQWDGTAKQMEKNGDHEMVYFYEVQTAEKEGILAKNRDRLLDAENRDSLISRVKKIMYTVITDINRGPVFGFNILNGANNFSVDISIDNVISGLIITNTEKLNILRTYTKGKEDAWNDAKKGWDDHNFINRGVRYDTYVNKTYDLEQQKYLEKSYMYMDKLLNSVRLQIRKISTEYYSVLSQIYKNLRETFKDNSSVLAKGIIVDEVKGFEKSLIDINDPNMQQALVGELRKVSPNIVFRQLIEALLDDEKSWKSDAKIARTVTGFFVGEKKENKEPGIFHDFADKTIENFLEIVYDTDDKDKIADKIKKEWLSMLHSSAAPLVYKDNKVYEGTIATLCRMSVPIGALSLKKAADEYIQVNSDTEIAVTGAKDRLSCLTYAAGFPICSLMGLDKVEREYFMTSHIGDHSYESTGLDTEFSDWRELPLLTPVSLLEDKLDRLPCIMCEIVKASIKTCDDVLKYGIYSVTDGCRLRLLCVKTELESELHRVSDEALACVNEFGTLKEQDESADADVGIDKHKGLLSRKDMLIQKISEIRDGLSNKDYYEDTDYELRITGKLYNDDDFMRIAKDELCYSPVMLLNAQKSITIIEKAYQTIEKMVTMLRYIK